MNKTMQKDSSNVSSRRAPRGGNQTSEPAGAKTVSLHLHIDQDLLTDLRDLAHAKGISLTRLIIAAAEREVVENSVKCLPSKQKILRLLFSLLY